MNDINKYLANLWIIKNPSILGKIAKGFFRAWVLNRPTLKTIEIFPTMSCNIACKMCSVEKYKKVQGAPLSLQEYESIAKQTSQLGAFSVNILGGEPLTYNRLSDVIRIFKQRGFLALVVTNGLLASRERCQELRDAGLHTLCFSLDNVDREKNDRIRGQVGHYDAVMAGIENAKSVGLDIRIGMVFFPGYVEEGIAVQQFAKKLGIKTSGGQVAPVGSWEGNPPLSKEEHDMVRTHLSREPLMTFDWAMSYKLRQCCPAGKEKIAISNFGDIFGCSVNPISFGNVRTESVAEIMARMQRFSQFAKNSPVCLAAEDTEFQERYLAPLSQFDSYPVSYTEHPTIKNSAEIDSLCSTNGATK
ncbi:hypothetical protein JCM14635_39040 [Megalodesulfovibrio paquesii]